LTPDRDNIGGQMLANITTEFNTGWMHGDIKGAFLSDTDTASNPELVTNGTFNANVDNWNTTSVTIARDTTIFSGGGIKVTTPGGASYAYQQVTGLVSGKQYIFTARAYNPSGNSGTDVATISIVSAGYTANTASSTTVDNTIQDLSVTFTASGTTETIYLSVVAAAYHVYGQNGSIGYFDNVSVRLTEEDRSVNNNGLAVYGTVTKSAVATGADLVAYSGFSASNYLQQPYNSDLDFGTGDLSIIFWYKMTSSSTFQCLLHRGDGGPGSWGSGNIIQIEMDGADLEFQLAGPVFSPNTQVQVPIAKSVTGEWQHFVGVRKGGIMSVYIDGVKYGNTASTQNVTNTAATTWIGQRPNSSRPASNTSMALFRMSASVPSAEQVKKIYEDEKFLFQENAKCTLYGSSDAVTALAYDDTTNLLHVGTSAGRSEFQGLRRINNTTDAVTTAISASNGLVAEQ